LCTALNAELKRGKLGKELRQLQQLNTQREAMMMRLEEVRFAEQHCRSFEKSVRKSIRFQREALEQMVESLPTRTQVLDEMKIKHEERIRLSSVISECERDAGVRHVKKKLMF
jgi:hypothetical protein